MIFGYKALKVELTKEGEPQLVSPSYRYKWRTLSESPAVPLVSSTMPGALALPEETAEGFDPSVQGDTSTGPGFYTRKSPELLISGGYYHPGKWPGVLTEMIVHGRVVHGTEGYRSEKATISSLFADEYTCEACEKAMGSTLVSRGKEEPPILLCDACLSKVKKALPHTRLKEHQLGNVWTGLSTRYGIPVVRRKF